jgi:hypothetical protein
MECAVTVDECVQALRAEKQMRFELSPCEIGFIQAALHEAGQRRSRGGDHNLWCRAIAQRLQEQFEAQAGPR